MSDSARANGFYTRANLNAVPAGDAIRATWYFVNNGTTLWGPGWSVRYVPEGHLFNRPFQHHALGVDAPVPWELCADRPEVRPGQRVGCTLLLQMPARAGVYVAHFQLFNPQGEPVGPLRYVRIGVQLIAGIHHFAFESFGSSHNLNDLGAGDPLTLQWRIRNSGSRSWSADHLLLYTTAAVPENTGVPLEPLSAETRIRFDQIASAWPVLPGESVMLTLPVIAPDSFSADFHTCATHWRPADPLGRPFGGTLWARLRVQRRPRRLQAGMNINPDQPVSNPVTGGELQGLHWVRYPYKAAARGRTVQAAFGEYDPLVADCAAQEISTLLVINQETVWGSTPWYSPPATADWPRYNRELALAAGQIAARYAGQPVAYQIWNEGDNPHSPHVSIYVPPAAYADMLQQVSAAIRAADPNATLVAMGLATGSVNAVPYLRGVQQALAGAWPVSALAIHPYGRWFHVQPMPGWGFGDMDTEVTRLLEAFPELPVWITEVGVVGGDRPIDDPDTLRQIGAYLHDLYTTMDRRYADRIPVMIWFAWSDLMENAGIVQADGQAKPAVYRAFTAVRDNQPFML